MPDPKGPPRTLRKSFLREYRSWNMMMFRCYNETHKSYSRYGGRGILVCGRWHKFENFLADMGKRPEGKTLDRIDNDGNYEPSNCRWATDSEQGRNMRINRWIEFDGRRMIKRDWARYLGINETTISRRIAKGMTQEQAIAMGKGRVTKRKALNPKPTAEGE